MAIETEESSETLIASIEQTYRLVTVATSVRHSIFYEYSVGQPLLTAHSTIWS
jgi:hypothetical protein